MEGDFSPQYNNILSWENQVPYGLSRERKYSPYKYHN